MDSSEKLHIDKEKLKKQFDVSHFGLNAVLRGIQLTFVGGEIQLPTRDSGTLLTARSSESSAEP